VYQNGAYVLHRLRETLGARAFWTDVRDYTRTDAGTSVTTAEFQQAMERATATDLSEFFRAGVYLERSR
jgi:aminopeptidase N